MAIELTPDQLITLAETLKQLGDISKRTGIDFDAYGTWDISYADNTIRIRGDSESGYRVDHYCQ